MPEHTFKRRCRSSRIMWEHDGEEHIETAALAAVFDSAGGRTTMTIVGNSCA
jgi:hypothetical protein